MDFFEAMECMQDGDKVRLVTWPEGAYIGVKEQEVKVFGKKKTRYSVINADESDLSPALPFSTLVKSEWEIFED